MEYWGLAEAEATALVNVEGGLVQLRASASTYKAARARHGRLAECRTPGGAFALVRRLVVDDEWAHVQ